MIPRCFLPGDFEDFLCFAIVERSFLYYNGHKVFPYAAVEYSNDLSKHITEEKSWENQF